MCSTCLLSACRRDLPFDAIEFVTYEQLKKAYKGMKGGRELNAAEVSVLGAGAGAATGLITCPLDVLKTRQMLGSSEYKNVLDCAVSIVRQEGFQALMKGWQPRYAFLLSKRGHVVGWNAVQLSPYARVTVRSCH